MSSRLAIRADASPSVGVGHVMRCCALAQAFAELEQAEITFYSAQLPERIRNRIVKSGFRIVELRSDAAGAEEFAFFSQLNENSPDWIVVDGYHFSTEFLNRCYAGPWQTLVIDDRFDTCNGADLFLNQNIPGTNRRLFDRNRLLSPYWALLRPEFREKIIRPRLANPTIQRVLVTFGGSDPAKMTSPIVLRLLAMEQGDFKIDVVVGGASQDIDRIRAIAEMNPDRVVVHYDSNRLAELFSGADLAIVAAGSTCYELACCGTPLLAVPVAENQVPIAASLERVQVGMSLDSSLVSPICFDEKRFASLFQELASDQDLRQSMIENGQRLVDGRGAARLAALMIGSRIVLREAVPEDAPTLWNWRHDNWASDFSCCDAGADPSVFLQWYSRRLQEDTETYWVLEDRSRRVAGVVRCKQVDDDSVSIAFTTEHDSQATGMLEIMLLKSLAKIYSDPTCKSIVTEIEATNENSKRAVDFCGFRYLHDSPNKGTPGEVWGLDCRAGNMCHIAAA